LLTHSLKMSKYKEEIYSIFEETKALLNGHFILRSGMRSANFFQCAKVCQYMDKVTRLATIMIEEIPFTHINTVVAPAMGGLVIGQEVARQLKARFLFLEKVDDRLALRRNFSLNKEDRVLLVEDVVTKGGRVKEAIEIILGFECSLIGVTSLVDRSTSELNLRAPFHGMLKMNFPTYEPDALPEELSRIPAVKPGS
jgi:orotate phosphoribosyltransferase